MNIDDYVKVDLRGKQEQGRVVKINTRTVVVELNSDGSHIHRKKSQVRELQASPVSSP